MKKQQFIFVLLIFVILTSCASTYNEVAPNTQNYVSTSSEDGVLLEYKYDVLNKKKYYKKESKKGIKVVAIKVTNKTEDEIVMGRDFKLVNSQGADFLLASNIETFSILKQSQGIYFLYLLLSFINFSTTDEYGNVEDVYPVGLVIGPGLALGNFFVAKSANKKFKTELTDFDLYGKPIKSGETAYGLVGIKTAQPESINIKLIQ